MFESYLTDFSKKSLDKQHKMIITIEGNIGSGKSTLLDQIKDIKLNKPHIVILEDVKEWTSFNDSKGSNILEKYYENQNKYGYCFQSLVLISRIQHLVEAVNNNPDTIIFTERCPFTDLNIFAKTLYDKGAMEEIEWLTYNQCHQTLNRLCDIKIDSIIYNKCSSETCMNRIEKRNRKGEQNIPIDLIKELDNRHNEWLSNEKEVYVFNGEVELEERGQEIQKLIDYINSKL
jgi:deoxyadenosine/deoxycytidine kinase